MAPWNGPAPAQPWDVLQADGVLQFYPWRDMVFKAWGSGQIPFWNPYQLGGTPLLANSQSAALYPPHILLGVLGIPTPAAITILAWIHLSLAGMGTYLLCRRLGGSKLGGFVAGASFCLSPFMLAWASLPSVITTVAWIPWLLAALHASFERGWRGLPLVAFSAAMMILAGHLQFVAYGFMAAVLLVAGLGISQRNWKTPCLVVAGLALGVTMAAPHLLPVLEFSKYSHRRNIPSAEGYAAYLAGAILPFELASVAVPMALGDPRQGVDIGDGKTVQEYWPVYVKRGANFAEGAVAVGPLVLGLLILAAWRQRQVVVLAAIALFALLLSLGSPLNLPLYYGVPGWSSTGSPGRIIVIAVLVACVIAGTGVRNRLPERRVLLSALAVALITSLSALVIPMLDPNWMQGLEPLGTAIKEVADGAIWLRTVPLLVVGCLALGLIHPKMTKYRGFLVAIPLLLCFLGGGTHLIMSGAAIPVEPAKSFERVAVQNRSWDLVFAAPAILPPNTAYLVGLHEIGGYDSLLHKETKAILDRINGEDSATKANGNMMFIKPNASSSALANAGVSRLITPAGAETIGGNRVSFTGGSARITKETWASTEVLAEGTGKLILHDRNIPGWTAIVEGKKRDVPTGDWLQVDLPVGKHTIIFRYIPTGFIAGVWAALLGWVLCGVIALRSRSPKNSRAA